MTAVTATTRCFLQFPIRHCSHTKHIPTKRKWYKNVTFLLLSKNNYMVFFGLWIVSTIHIHVKELWGLQYISYTWLPLGFDYGKPLKGPYGPRRRQFWYPFYSSLNRHISCITYCMWIFKSFKIRKFILDVLFKNKKIPTIMSLQTICCWKSLYCPQITLWSVTTLPPYLPLVRKPSNFQCFFCHNPSLKHSESFYYKYK